MRNVVSYQRVPMPRGLAFALYHIDKHGGHVDIFSADRTVKTIAEHNRQFGTNLHAQQYLVDLANSGKGNPANPVNRTSHCYFSDGNKVYGVPAGAKIPWYKLGIDLSDKGKVEDVSHFLAVAHSLGYNFVQPYPSGSERHHVVSVNNVIPTLEHWSVISKVRLP